MKALSIVPLVVLVTTVTVSTLQALPPSPSCADGCATPEVIVRVYAQAANGLTPVPKMFTVLHDSEQTGCTRIWKTQGGNNMDPEGVLRERTAYEMANNVATPPCGASPPAGDYALNIAITEPELLIGGATFRLNCYEQHLAEGEPGTCVIPPWNPGGGN